jgi:hypothetical protein
MDDDPLIALRRTLEALEVERDGLRHDAERQRAEMLAARDRALELAQRCDALIRDKAALLAEVEALTARRRRSGLFAALRRRMTR